MFGRIVIVIALMCPGICSGEQSQEPTKWAPQDPPSQVVNFEQLMIAKISDDGKFVRIIAPRYNWEEKSVTVTVARKNKDETYSWLEEVRKIPMSVPSGSYRMSVPTEFVQAWSLNGTEIDTTTLASRLKTPTHVLVDLKVDPKKKPAPVDRYYASILKTDTFRVQLPADAGAKYLDKTIETK